MDSEALFAGVPRGVAMAAICAASLWAFLVVAAGWDIGATIVRRRPREIKALAALIGLVAGAVMFGVCLYNLILVVGTALA